LPESRIRLNEGERRVRNERLMAATPLPAVYLGIGSVVLNVHDEAVDLGLELTHLRHV